MVEPGRAGRRPGSARRPIDDASRSGKVRPSLYERAKARGAIVIVIEGERGGGVSVQADIVTTLKLPEMLEKIAQDIRELIAQDIRGLSAMKNRAKP